MSASREAIAEALDFPFPAADIRCSNCNAHIKIPSKVQPIFCQSWRCPMDKDDYCSFFLPEKGDYIWVFGFDMSKEEGYE